MELTSLFHPYCVIKRCYSAETFVVSGMLSPGEREGAALAVGEGAQLELGPLRYLGYLSVSLQAKSFTPLPGMD